MSEETAGQARQQTEQGSESQRDCGSKHPTPLAVDQKAAREQAASDEVIRARNKAVRAHGHTPDAESSPPFSDHSGEL
jgi:hypothetical protein